MNKKFFIVMSVLALFAVAGIFAEESVKNPATETQVEQQAPQDNAKAIKYINSNVKIIIAGGYPEDVCHPLQLQEYRVRQPGGRLRSVRVTTL